jgi:preprotein translocase subunit SecG
MTILNVVLIFLLVLVSLFLGLLVLVQKPRSDSGLGTAMGGGVPRPPSVPRQATC